MANNPAPFRFGQAPQNQDDSLVDPLLIKETIMTRVQDSLKGFSMPADDNGVGSVLTQLLPPLIGAIATSLSTAVSEVLSKTLQKMERCIDRQNEQRLADPKTLCTLRRLTYDNDRLEQYTRRENFRISGVAVAPGETSAQTEKLALNLMKETGVTVTGDDIADCHRVGRPRDGKQQIIVRFVNRKKRTEVMRNKKSLKTKEAYSKIFINDDLTPLRTKLLKYVKTLHKVEKAWTIGGKIFCEMKKIPGHTDNTKPVTVESPDDLFKLGETSVDWGQLGLAHLDDRSC